MKLKNYFTIVLFSLLIISNLNAQVGIGTTDPKSTLDISASDSSDPSILDGILIPRINAFPSTNPGRDQHGMLVFLVSGANKGFYYWNWDIDINERRWIQVGAEEWKPGTNLIYAARAKDAGTDIVITDNGANGARFGLGTDNPIERFEIKGSGDNDFQITSANTNPPNIILYNTGGSIEIPEPLPNNREIGSFIAKTHDGNGVVEVGAVRFYMDGDGAAGSTPTRFVIQTTPDGSNGVDSTNPQLVIKNNGNVGIGTPDPEQLLDVDGSMHVKDSLGIGMTAPAVPLDVNGTAFVRGLLGVGGDAIVLGNTTLAGTLSVSNATNLNSTLNVSGATSLGSTLGVTGNSTLTGTLRVNNNSVLNGTLSVTGNSTLNSALTVSGTTNLNSNLNVTGTTRITTLNTGGAVYSDTSGNLSNTPRGIHTVAIGKVGYLGSVIRSMY